MSKLKIVFMGTPEFAVASLDILVKNNYNVVAVITSVDKPAGRGYKLQESAVKKYALQKGLKIMQPEKLKNPDFIAELKALEADLQIVVAFRMLPESVWAMPPLGTFNLHASLLPQYRGAAPINHAIINGERVSGVSTFFLKQEIDTGNIIYQEKIEITENENAGSLHDKLMKIGAELVHKTVKSIEDKTIHPIDQNLMFNKEIHLNEAPKIYKENCKINWNQSTDSIFNLIRGLSPYPTAFTNIISDIGVGQKLKIFAAKKEIHNHLLSPGTIITDHKKSMKIASNDGYITLLEVQLEGKSKMDIESFLRGYPLRVAQMAE